MSEFEELTPYIYIYTWTEGAPKRGSDDSQKAFPSLVFFAFVSFVWGGSFR